MSTPQQIIRCIAIDDEPLALSIIENFCNKIPSINLVASLSNGIEAIEMLKTEQIDLIFIDINMPHLSGIEVVRMLENPPLIIFTTAYQNYALTGFELSALDYILKPFSFDRFFIAVNKAQKQLGLIHDASVSSTYAASGVMGAMGDCSADYIMVKSDYSVIKVPFADTLYIEGLKDYVKIHLLNKGVVTKSTMKNIQERLPSNFMRVHRSFVVNLDYIERIENNHIVIGKNKIPLGNQYKEPFFVIIDKNKL